MHLVGADSGFRSTHVAAPTQIWHYVTVVIGREDVMRLLLEAVSSFRDVWEKDVFEENRDGNGRLYYLDASAFAGTSSIGGNQVRTRKYGGHSTSLKEFT